MKIFCRIICFIGVIGIVGTLCTTALISGEASFYQTMFLDNIFLWYILLGSLLLIFVCFLLYFYGTFDRDLFDTILMWICFGISVAVIAVLLAIYIIIKLFDKDDVIHIRIR